MNARYCSDLTRGSRGRTVLLHLARLKAGALDLHAELDDGVAQPVARRRVPGRLLPVVAVDPAAVGRVVVRDLPGRDLDLLVLQIGSHGSTLDVELVQHGHEDALAVLVAGVQRIAVRVVAKEAPLVVRVARAVLPAVARAEQADRL